MDCGKRCIPKFVYCHKRRVRGCYNKRCHQETVGPVYTFLIRVSALDLAIVWVFLDRYFRSKRLKEDPPKVLRT